MKNTFTTLLFCILLNISLVFAKNTNNAIENCDIHQFSKNLQPVVAENPIPYDVIDYLDLMTLYFGVEIYLV